jgi:DNA-3-methyladenine glycosylase I
MGRQSPRCAWTGDDPLMIAYHDTEWGVPLHNDQNLFEFLVLEGMQAGLSWRTVLHKREAFREAFADFDPEKVARFNTRSIERLMKDARIIRNRAKLEAAVNNAKRFLEVQDEHGSFAAYQWDLVGGRPIVNRYRAHEELPATSEISDAWSRELKKRGFRFVGSTILYAHMQATGMINDHLVGCFRHDEVKRLEHR